MKEKFSPKEVKPTIDPAMTPEKVKKFREADAPVTEEDLEEFAKKQQK